MAQAPERVFSRRSFILFILLAPASILTVFAIILASQYRQYHGMVSSHAEVTAFAETPADRARLDSVRAALDLFSAGAGPDSLAISPRDLDLLAASSPVTRRQGIHFRFLATDSNLVALSTQRVDSLSGRASWLFKKITPPDFQYLNARLEGVPQWKAGVLEFVPDRGFLNGGRIPRAALLKRSGLSPRDFIDASGLPAYRRLLGALDTVLASSNGVTLVRSGRQ